VSSYEFAHAVPTVTNYRKYRDLWSDNDDVDVLAPDMRAGCVLCGEFFDGTAREGILWQRAHRQEVHGHRLEPFKKRSEARMNPGTVVRTNEKGELSHINGNVNSKLSNMKWTREKMLQVRDDFFEEHGRMPTSKDKGFSGSSLFDAVRNNFGGWLEYQEFSGESGD